MFNSLLHMIACSSRYKHLGQFAPLGGEQTAAQLPGDWVSIGHSSQWLWYSVYARYCLYTQNCLNFETFLSISYWVSFNPLKQQASKLAYKGVSGYRLDKTFYFWKGLKSHLRKFNIFQNLSLPPWQSSLILNFFWHRKSFVSIPQFF